MSSKMKNQAMNEYEKQFLKKFDLLCRNRSSWQVWADFIAATACAIANSVDKTSCSYEKREKEFEDCIKRLSGATDDALIVVSEMFGIVTMALDDNPEQDFLGALFMKLNLGNHWKGQFFTPYSVCKLMAEINSINVKHEIEDKGWVSINDCACGAGATLIAMANALKQQDINYQTHALFVAQDIDRVAGMMCFIQLSLLGCPAYVVIADSLINPIEGRVLQPTLNDDQEFWFTPMYFSDVWHFRRVFDTIKTFTI